MTNSIPFLLMFPEYSPEESLRAVAGRSLNTAALLGLIAHGALGWGGLLADARHGDTRNRLLETLGRTA